MNRVNREEICVEDCCMIECNEEVASALFHFVKNIEPFIYCFSKREKDNEPIVYYDYGKRAWVANRYIGECEFEYNNTIYILKITPRYGNELILKLFEYIYSTKLPPSYHTISKTKDIDVHKLFISLIWITQLKKAFKHGLLQENKQIKEEGSTIRGKFLVQKSLLSIYVKNSIHYQYNFKDIDNIPNHIIYKAYLVLKKEYHLSDALISDTVKADLSKLGHLLTKNKSLTYEKYKKIKYRSLFKSYKPLVDLSWSIISSKMLSIENSTKLENSFFLDMAEIWEVFIQKVLQRNLKKEGWILEPDSYNIYTGTFFNRKLIPDIVFSKNDKILIVDAKYKRMEFRNIDVDREDLFQIHTYSYFFNEDNNIVYSSLVYPLEKEHIETRNNTLFSKEDQKNKFFISGIEVQDINLFDYKIEKFINSLLKKI